MAQWFRTAGTDEAEVAVMVADLWQGLGIGGRLVAEVDPRSVTPEDLGAAMTGAGGGAAA